MSRYYFHLRTGAGIELADEEGDELLSVDAAEEQARASIKELVRGSALDWAKCSFEVHDEQNRHLMTVWFQEAAAQVANATRHLRFGEHPE